MCLGVRTSRLIVIGVILRDEVMGIRTRKAICWTTQYTRQSASEYYLPFSFVTIFSLILKVASSTNTLIDLDAIMYLRLGALIPSILNNRLKLLLFIHISH